MTTESLTVSTVLPASPEALYDAWLDSFDHGEMTGGAASIDPSIGGRHSAWDGYISGATLELEPGRRIVQAWRTSEFPKDAPDSRIEITLEPHGEDTLLTIAHTSIPEGQGKSYEQGWVDHYFDPMRAYFTRRRGQTSPPETASSSPATKAAPRKAAAKKPAATKKPAAKKAAKKPAAKKAAKKASSKKAAPKKAAKKLAARKARKPLPVKGRGMAKKPGRAKAAKPAKKAKRRA